MNRSAIDDLLGGILSGWYESVADWVPPGHASARTCTTCGSSILADVVDVADWPHDLMHQLAGAVETAFLQILDSLVPPPVASYDAVRRFMVDWLGGNSDDLLDVLRECVAPKLDEWVASELERAFATVDHLR